MNNISKWIFRRICAIWSTSIWDLKSATTFKKNLFFARTLLTVFIEEITGNLRNGFLQTNAIQKFSIKTSFWVHTTQPQLSVQQSCLLSRISSPQLPCWNSSPDLQKADQILLSYTKSRFWLDGFVLVVCGFCFAFLGGFLFLIHFFTWINISLFGRQEMHMGYLHGAREISKCFIGHFLIFRKLQTKQNMSKRKMPVEQIRLSKILNVINH